MASVAREMGSRSDPRPADVENTGVRISVKTDYAIRAAAELAVLGEGGPVKAQLVGASQDIPLKFLLNILGDLRRAGVVRATRGVNGGYQLARPAPNITLAEV